MTAAGLPILTTGGSGAVAWSIVAIIFGVWFARELHPQLRLRTTAKSLAKTSSLPSQASTTILGPDFGLWFVSQCVDYGCCLAMCYSWTIWKLKTDSAAQCPTYFAVSMIIQGFITLASLHFREQLHFWLLGRRVSQYKKQDGLTSETWHLLFQIAVFSQFVSLPGRLNGLFHIDDHIDWSMENAIHVFVQFYILLIIRDVVFLAPLHSLMHTPKWYAWHKTHHQVGRDAQGMHAFHIDIPDLIIENTGAQTILFLGQYLAGVPVGLNFIVAAMLTCHDGALHSVNPYSVMYFCPPLDYLVKGNICHQLHHALNKDYLQFVPYAHIWSPERRRKDMDKYNATFKTDFALR